MSEDGRVRVPIWKWLPALLRRLFGRKPEPLYFVNLAEVEKVMREHPEGGVIIARKVKR